MTDNQSTVTETSQGVLQRCHWHPDVETGLTCNRCGKHMCAQCLGQAAVGVRCKECGRPTRPPTYDVRPTSMARAAMVGAGVAVGGGILWAILNQFLGAIPFFSVIVAVGVGYLAGEIISLSVNRKRGPALAWIAATSVVGAFLIAWVVNPFNFGLYGLLFIAAGVYLAVQRVRR